MKVYEGRGRIDPHVLDLGTSWRWVVSFKPRLLYPRGNVILFSAAEVPPFTDCTCWCVSSLRLHSPEYRRVVTHSSGASGRRSQEGTRCWSLLRAPLSMKTTEPWRPLAKCEDGPGNPDSGGACPPWSRCCKSFVFQITSIYIHRY
jgi:hypothetical protein